MATQAKAAKSHLFPENRPTATLKVLGMIRPALDRKSLLVGGSVHFREPLQRRIFFWGMGRSGGISEGNRSGPGPLTCPRTPLRPGRPRSGCRFGLAPTALGYQCSRTWRASVAILPGDRSSIPP